VPTERRIYLALEPSPAATPIDNEPQDYNLSATGLVSRTLSLYVRRILEYVLLIGLLGVMYTLLSFAVLWIFFPGQALELIDLVATDPLTVVLNLLFFAAAPEETTVILLVLMVVGMLIFAVSAGAAIRLSLEDYRRPGSSSVSDSLSYSTSRLGALIGVQLVVGLISLVIVLPGFILTLGVLFLFLAGQQVALEMVALALIALLGSLIIVIYVNIRLSPALAVCVAEDTGAMDSVKRAWRMTGGNVWHIIGARLLLGLLIGVLGVLIASFFPANGVLGEWGPVISSLIAALFFNPIDYVFQTVLYRDLESRESSTREQAQDWW
jgi:hypothetical protein